MNKIERLHILYRLYLCCNKCGGGSGLFVDDKLRRLAVYHTSNVDIRYRVRSGLFVMYTVEGARAQWSSYRARKICDYINVFTIDLEKIKRSEINWNVGDVWECTHGGRGLYFNTSIIEPLLFCRKMDVLDELINNGFVQFSKLNFSNIYDFLLDRDMNISEIKYGLYMNITNNNEFKYLVKTFAGFNSICKFDLIQELISTKDYDTLFRVMLCLTTQTSITNRIVRIKPKLLNIDNTQYIVEYFSEEEDTIGKYMLNTIEDVTDEHIISNEFLTGNNIITYLNKTMIVFSNYKNKIVYKNISNDEVKNMLNNNLISIIDIPYEEAFNEKYIHEVTNK